MKMNKVFLLGVSLFALGACSGNTTQTYDYTMNTYLSTSPSTWNPHTWETSDESYIASFCEMGFYDVMLNEAKDGYVFVNEMASGLPVAVDPFDLTDEEIDTYYSESGNPPNNCVWDIPLNQNAKWEDGDAITSEDYIDSMELQLSSEYANYRADSYYGSSFVIVNAENFYKQNRYTIEPAISWLDSEGYVPDDTGIYFLNLGKGNYDFAAAVYSGGYDETTNLDDVISQFAGQYGVTAEADRITNAWNYYIWKAQDHSTSSHADDWAKVDEPIDVSSEMMTDDHLDLDIDDLDYGFTDAEGNQDYIWKMIDDSDNGPGWVESNLERYYTDELTADLKTVISAVGRNQGNFAKSWAWKLPLFTRVMTYVGDVTMDEVGIKALDEYTLRLYLANSISGLDLKFSLSSNWLVKTDLYERLSFELDSGGRATRYGTVSADNYMSYGPYRLENFTANSRIHIVKNDNWYGWTDGQHEGQFQLEEVVTQIISTHDNAMSSFLKGELDDIDLTVNDVREYGGSARATTTYESYTQKVSFNSDYATLARRQSGNNNKTILSNKNFRQGLSLAIDRRDFASQATSGSKEFTGLLNDLYLANNATGETYRSTAQGQSVYGMVYDTLGGETIYDPESGEEPIALTEDEYGYNPALAKEYVKLGIKEELASDQEGHLEPGDTISIEFRVYDNESENTQAANSFLSSAWTQIVAAAVADLKAENVLASDENIGFDLGMIKDQDYYTTASNGGYDMIFSIWGGAAINPCGLMDVYCSIDQTQCCEYGFKGKQDQAYLDIDADGNGIIGSDERKSFHAWNEYMQEDLSCNDSQYLDSNGEPNAGQESDYEAAHNRKFNILAGLEAGIINRFEAIPLVARGSTSLLGFKLEYASKNYISLIGYGGIREMTFNYTNAEWDAFCAQYGNDLTELYKQ